MRNRYLRSFAQVFTPEVELAWRDQYQYQHLSELARKQRPSNPQATATGFSGWVFDLQHGGHHGQSHDTEINEARKHRLLQGRFAERDIEQFRRWYDQTAIGSVRRGDWLLEFADPLDDSADPFVASCLRVHGEPLRCKPDVVLRNRINGDILIIERKITWVPVAQIPAYGWPNLRTQLWCYSWIDQWARTDNVYLVAQIWRRSREYEDYEMIDQSKLVPIYPRWQKGDARFHQECLSLFQTYGGEFSADWSR